VWVLILLLNNVYGGTITSVPGYRSEVSCKAAGEEYTKRVGGELAKIGGFVCIPGPA
jgi:hypothetical protein